MGRSTRTRTEPYPAAEPPAGTGRGRLLTGVTWAVLLLGLWTWGRELTEGDGTANSPRVDRAPLSGGPRAAPQALPAAHEPLEGASHPVALDIDALGYHARVAAQPAEAGAWRDTADASAVRHTAAPAAPGTATLTWHGNGPAPGEAGAALLSGEPGRPVPGAGLLRPGMRMTVTRADGTVAEFTVSRVRLVGAESLQEAPSQRAGVPGGAQLRLLTGAGGDTGAGFGSGAAPGIEVSGYLTGSREGRMPS